MNKLYKIDYKEKSNDDECVIYIIANSILDACGMFISDHHDEDIDWIAVEHLEEVVNMPKEVLNYVNKRIKSE